MEDNTMKMINNGLEKSYDLAIEHAIMVVKRVNHTMFGEQEDIVCAAIIKTLNKLKNTTDEKIA